MQSDFWSEAYPVLPFSGADVGRAALAAGLMVAVLVVLLAVAAVVVVRRRRRSAGRVGGLVAEGPAAHPAPPRR